MAEAPGASLLRLLAWLSPSFPVGSFSYSHGLELAIGDGLIRDAAELRRWLTDLMLHGSAWNDAVLLAEAWRPAQAGEGWESVAELAEALAGSLERHLESMSQGSAFRTAAAAWGESASGPADCAYPVAVGATAGANGVPLPDALAGFLQAFVSNQAQAAIRLSLIGQSEAVTLLAAMEPVILETVAAASRSTLDDLGGFTFIAEIASMRHETQYARLFRS